MYILDKAEARRILVTREDYEPYQADFLLEKYPAIRDELADAVRQWLRDDTIQDVTVEGLTIRQVMEAKRCEFLVAVSYLNGLLDEGLSDEARDRYREYLVSPVVIK